MTRIRRFALLAVLIGCLTVSCLGYLSYEVLEDFRAAGAPKEVSADDVARFGDITIPDGAQVLRAEYSHFIDTLYEMVLRVDADQAEQLLKRSRFTAQMHVVPEGFSGGRPAIAGPSLATATDLKWAQDRVETTANGWVVRSVLQDTRSSAEIYLHIQVFTT